MMNADARGAAPRHLLRVAVLSMFALLCGLGSEALAIPVGYTCIGNCGTSGADGVVSAPPGGTTYDWVSSSGGVDLGAQDLNQRGETNGSILRSLAFAANAGDELEFDFNYVTSDGGGFGDYAWSRLLDTTLTPVAVLFTARTTASGNTSPGFGLPANNAVVTPPSTAIIPGGPAWSPLGPSSGGCFAAGCGYTGWINSSYTVPVAGNYILEFGVVNWADQASDSGLALTGATIDGVSIAAVPEPGVLALLGIGVLFGARRRRAARQSA